MQLFLRAADVAMLPYLRTLNSAVLMTVLAFDLPVIAPPIGGIAETIEPAVSVTFEPGDVQSLADGDPRRSRPAARRRAGCRASDLRSPRRGCGLRPFFDALLAAVDGDRLTSSDRSGLGV